MPSSLVYLFCGLRLAHLALRTQISRPRFSLSAVSYFLYCNLEKREWTGQIHSRVSLVDDSSLT